MSSFARIHTLFYRCTFLLSSFFIQSYYPQYTNYGSRYYSYGANLAVDGHLSNGQQADNKHCAVTNSAGSNKHSFLVVDLGVVSTLDKVTVWTALGELYDPGREKISQGLGTLVGVLDAGNKWGADSSGELDWDTINDQGCWGAQDCEVTTTTACLLF
jgi:hypothetical protein